MGMKRTLVALSSFFLCTVAVGWSSDAAAKADKYTCKRVAKSAGLMSAVIDQACGGYKEYQKTCLSHVGREGIPDLVRADNYMQCLCDEAKQELRGDAGDLCHASASIHGLLDQYMLLVQTAAADTDEKKVALNQRESSLERLMTREEQANKESQKAEKEFTSVKSRTDQALARNQLTQDKAQKLYEQTIAKLRAAEKAAQQKLASVKSKISAENQKLRGELAQAQAHATAERERHAEVNQAVSMRQREVGLAKNLLATAVSHEQKAVEDHRQSMDAAGRATARK